MVSLEASKLFNQLPADELARLKAVARELRYNAGQEIFKAGDPGDGVYVVKAGAVQISALLAHGERHVFSRVLPGDVFGEMSLLDSQPRSAFATAEKETHLYFVPREQMVDLLARSPGLSLKLVQEISGRLREFNQRYIRALLEAERLVLVGRFASSIVHDLKNPLCVIGLGAELMTDPASTPADRLNAQQRIARQIERITNMVNDILEFTRGTQTTQTLALRDYGSFVQGIVEEYEPELLLKSIVIQVESLLPSVKLALNPKRISRVFVNLFGNAADMMPQGGAIKLRFQVTDAEVVTEVEDTGPGIAPAVADRLFEAFVTHGKPKGTGLGLSISQRILQEHGGKISARNRPGGGAIFTFSLPRPK